MQQTFNSVDGLYLHEECLLIYTIMKYQLRKQSTAEIEKLNIEIKSRNKIKEGKSKPSPKISGFVNKITIKSWSTSSTSNSNSDADQPHCREESISEGEDIGIRKYRERSRVDIIN